MKSYSRTNATNVLPGYKAVAYVAPLSYFTTVAKPDPAATGDARFIITEDHVFPVDKGFHKLNLIKNATSGTASAKGDPGAKWFEHKLSISIPGDNPKAQSLAQDLLNEDLIVLVEDPDCAEPRFIQYGCSCDPGAVGESTMESGTLGGDKGKMWKIDLTSTCRDFYEGTLTLAAD